MYADENFYHNRTHKNTRESVLLNYESVLLNYETLLDLFSNYLHYLMSKSNKIFLSLFARLLNLTSFVQIKLCIQSDCSSRNKYDTTKEYSTTIF